MQVQKMDALVRLCLCYCISILVFIPLIHLLTFKGTTTKYRCGQKGQAVFIIMMRRRQNTQIRVFWNTICLC